MLGVRCWLLDVLVAASPRCAVSQVLNLPTSAREQRSADYKSAKRQITNLRYAKHILSLGERHLRLSVNGFFIFY
jgi:hypothetical protein